MAETYKCPRCNEEVLAPPVSAGRVTMGALSGANINYAQCPKCHAWLERVTDAQDSTWQLQKGVEQPPWGDG
jgi:hypothetical protein